MNKLLGICFFLLVLVASNVWAADVSVGASTWYAKMEFLDSDNMEMKPALLYGPLVSINF